MTTSAEYKVCENCELKNLTEAIGIAKCSRCSSKFCEHFSSIVDTKYCVECLAEIKVEKEVVVQLTPFYTKETGELQYKRGRLATDIRISGTDWLFMSRKIPTLTDLELELVIEYHKSMAQLLLDERETRRMNYRHRFAGVKVTNTGSASGESVVVETKTTKSISSTKNGQSAKALVEGMLNSGKTMAEIMSFIQQLKQNIGGA